MTLGSIRTLLVEDAAPDAGLIHKRLRSGRAGRLDVEHLPTLDAALVRLRAGDIDVVLLDLNLPDSSGIETLARLHGAAPDVPVVVVIDDDDADLALRVVRARAEDCLVRKKADAPALVRAIRHALERRRRKTLEVERNTRRLTNNEARLRLAVDRSSDGMAVVSRKGAVLFANPSAARLIGRPPEELKGTMFGFPFTSLARLELSVGADRVVEVHLVETDWDGQPAWLASVFDITEHKHTQADLEAMTARMCGLNLRLERLARIDPLTEILNRRGLEAGLSIELLRKRRTGAPLAALLLDCDDFKRINETLGHATGDNVLKELAHRLKDALRPSDHIGRIGGDEFIVLLPDTPFAEAFQVAERLRLSAFDSPLRLSTGSVQVTASLGIEMVSEEILTIDDVLVRTQTALQHSKRGGKNRVSTQNGGSTGVASDSEDLVLALQAGTGFRVIRQPIVSLPDGSVVGWEMLTRGPPGIFERPRDFFRVALERSILAQVDLHCLKACIRGAPEHPPLPRCHVNVFPSTLLDAPPERLIELFPLWPAGVRFCVEISEQRMIGDPSLLRGHVRALQEAGILVAIDDVGFGRSSLETLILLEPDLVKIDPKFIQGASRDAGKERSLRRMVDVVASTESELVAEGVESPEDLDLLLEIGVRLGQGSLWGDPA